MQHLDNALIARISEYMGSCLLEEDYTPTVREVGIKFGISKSTAQKYMAKISAEGLCPQLEKYSRDGTEKTAWLENDIACGAPSYQEENIAEYLRLPVSVFGKGEKYIVTASGDSMTGAGITAGDLLVVRKQVTASDGDIVVALVNGENTLKRLRYRQDGTPYLHPENSAYSDIEFGPDDTFYIQGVLTHIIKHVENRSLQDILS